MSSIQEILQYIASSREAANTEDAPQTLMSRITAGYQEYVLSAVQSLLTGHEELTPGLIQVIKHFLEQHWRLINGTAFSYTAIPDHPVTQLLIDLAALVPSEDDESSVIKTLMPTVNIFSDYDENLDLTDQTLLASSPDDTPEITSAVRRVLNTHILGPNGDYLIPINLLVRLGAEDLIEDPHHEGYTTIRHPYYDVYEHGEAHSVSLEAFDRLIGHTQATQDIYDTFCRYQTLVNDKSSLLDHLKVLNRQLQKNDAHGGRGTERDAGAGAYPALLTFKGYYEALGESETGRIPKKLKEEIDKLLDYAFNYESNKAHYGATCIYVRRTVIQDAMVGHEETLSDIGVSGESKQALIDKTLGDFNAAKESLVTAVTEEQYTGGTDRLPISNEVLVTTGVNIHIASQVDVRDFLKLTPDAINSLCQRDEIANQVLDALPDITDLILLIATHPPSAQLSALLKAMSGKIADKYLAKPRDFNTLLQLLDHDEHAKLVCDALSDTLNTLIQSSGDFRRLTKGLSDAAANAAYKTLKHKLPSLIHSGYDFADILAHLPPGENFSAVCELLKEQLPTIRDKHNNFLLANYFYTRLDKNDCQAFMDKMSDVLPNMAMQLEESFALSTLKVGGVVLAMVFYVLGIILTPVNPALGIIAFSMFGLLASAAYLLPFKPYWKLDFGLNNIVSPDEDELEAGEASMMSVGDLGIFGDVDEETGDVVIAADNTPGAGALVELA